VSPTNDSCAFADVLVTADDVAGDVLAEDGEPWSLHAASVSKGTTIHPSRRINHRS
jgi:hypothetical protein